MPHTQLNRTGQTRLHYVRTLASAYKRFSFIIDPDYAIQNEVDAWNKIRRDPDIAHAIQKRRSSVAGLRWKYKEASDEPQDKLGAKIMTELTKQTKRFHRSRFNLADAIFRGDSWEYIVGKRKMFQMVGDIPRRWWVPERLDHIDRFRTRIRRTDHDQHEDKALTTVWDIFSIKRERWEEIRDPRAFIRHAYDQTEDTLGYGRGLLQSIYFFWRAKEIVLTQGLAALERWAQGLIHIKVDGVREGSVDKNNDEVVDSWIAEMNKHRSDNVLVSDKRDEIEVHDMPGRSATFITEIYNLLQRGIDRMILTSTLPTGGQGGKGSMGQGGEAKVQQEELEETIQADREELSETLDTSFSTLIWDRNEQLIQAVVGDKWMDAAKRPTFEITQEKIEDPMQNLQIIKAAREAGLEVLKSEAYEKLQLTRPRSGEEILPPMAAPQPAFGQPQPGLPPAPGAEGGNGLGQLQSRRN